MVTDCIQNVDSLYTQDREEKVKTSKNNLEEGEGELFAPENKEASIPKTDPKKLFGEYKHIRMTESQYNKLVLDFGESKVAEYIRRADEYVQMTGKIYKDYNLTIRNWISRDGGTDRQGSPKKDRFGENSSFDIEEVKRLMEERSSRLGESDKA